MNEIVLLMVVAVVLSSTLKYCDAVTSEELCGQIKSNKVKILTMGARGRSQEDAHFYILTEGGYMFKVPLANLHFDANKKTTYITIDREHIRADELLKMNASLFTTEHRFFLISNEKKNAFLGRLSLQDNKQQQTTFYRLYNLSGCGPTRDHDPDFLLYYSTFRIMGSVGFDSNIAYGFEQIDKQLSRQCSFQVIDTDVLKLTEPSIRFVHRYQMEFARKEDIVTLFYHKDDPKSETGYYFFLNAIGQMTVTRRNNSVDFESQADSDLISKLYSDEFEVSLSNFVECRIPKAKPVQQASPKQATNETVPASGTSGIYLPLWIILLGIGVFVVLCSIVLFYTFWTKQRHQKKKGNNNKLDVSNLASPSDVLTSNVSSCSPTSSGSNFSSKVSSAFLSVKSKIVGLLERNKEKQAKRAAKGKKAKPKKPKV